MCACVRACVHGVMLNVQCFFTTHPPTYHSTAIVINALTGLRRINTSYSRISFVDIAAKLKLDSAEDAEYVCAKNIRDGVIKAQLDHDVGAMLSRDQVGCFTVFYRVMLVLLLSVGYEPSRYLRRRRPPCFDDMRTLLEAHMLVVIPTIL